MANLGSFSRWSSFGFFLEDAERDWDRMINIYRGLIRHWLTRTGVAGSDLDDVLQDCLMGLIHGIKSFRHNGNPGAFRNWLRTLVVHRAYSWFRHVLGGFYLQAKQPRRARDAFQKAVELRTAALTIDPENEKIARRLAESRINLAQSQARLQEFQSSTHNDNRAIDTLSGALERSPDSSSVVVSLCSARLNSANLLADLGDRSLACERLTRAIDDLQRFYQAAPEKYAFRNLLFMLHANRAEYLDLKTSAGQVVADWQRAIELASNQEHRRYCELRLVRIHITLDRFQNSAERLKRIATEQKLDQDSRMEIASLWGLLAGRIGHSLKEGAPPNRPSLDTSDAGDESLAAMQMTAIQASIEELRQLAADNYFVSNPSQIAVAHESQEFDPVRQSIGDQAFTDLLARQPERPGPSPSTRQTPVP